MARARPIVTGTLGVSLDEINAHFCAISSAAPPLTPLDVDNVLLLEPYYGREQLLTLPTFKFRQITAHEVANLLRRAKSRAKGPDGVTAAMLKLLTPAALGLLQVTFNASLSGDVPNIMEEIIRCPTPEELDAQIALGYQANFIAPRII